ncbi:MAG: LysM peptidoglycan-binding domain-containing protein [Bacteroidota bacterium]|nr:LysM peptidoglycan-binding domain-containing protein [Bacteroidota bacterium]
MKRVICGFVLLLFVLFICVKTNAQSAYSMHTIASGETLSVLVKKYHTTVGDVMRLNGMNTNSQLHIGDKIKIPAGGTVVAQKPAPPASAPAKTQDATAKTHVVEKGETLYRLSKEYNISVDKLIALNHLSKPTTHIGQILIISDGVAPQKTATETKEKPVPVQADTKAPALQNNTTSTASTTTQTPLQSTATETPVQQNSTPTPSVTTPKTTVVPSSENNANAVTNTAYSNNNTTAPKEGFFITQYGKEEGQKKEQNKTGSTMTFKSASGWADKKYYILMNDVPTGSIVKIQSGKTELYAKVLWNLGEMKQNDGLLFRISTAAAAALGITDEKFDLKVSYFE